MQKLSTTDAAPNLWEYWEIIRLHLWWILPTSVMLFCASVGAITILPDYYQATTTIIVDPQKISEQYVTTPVTTERLGALSQAVLSTTRLQRLIDRFQLYSELRGSSSEEQIVEHMRQAIKVEVKEGSSVSLSSFTITYQGKAPNQVAQVANELAAGFVDWNLESREQQLNGTTDFLSAHLLDAKRDLKEQEAKLSAYRMQHLGEMPDQRESNVQAVTGLQSSLQSSINASNRLEEERTLLLRLPHTSEGGATGQIPGNGRAGLELEKARLEGELSSLRQRYTDRHPDVVTKIGELDHITQQLQQLPPPSLENRPPERSAAAVRLEMIDSEMEKLKKEQAQIKVRITSYQAKADAVPLREQQLLDLTRNYDVSKRQYESLLDKTYSANMAADLEVKQKAERFTILDPARAPTKPFKPKRSVLMAAAAAISLFFSIALAVVIEKLDRTLKTEKELKDLLPKPGMLFGSIPEIQTPADRRRRVWIVVLTSVVSLLACFATGAFLWKRHPIL